MKRSEAFAMLDGIILECSTARLALSRLARQVARDASILAADGALKPSHVKNAEDRIEITYTLRLFAEFEAVLLEYWLTLRHTRRRRRSPMEALMDRVAARQYVDTRVLQRAHEVRAYRNDIVHRRLRKARITVRECKSRLATFLSYLPPEW